MTTQYCCVLCCYVVELARVVARVVVWKSCRPARGWRLPTLGLERIEQVRARAGNQLIAWSSCVEWAQTGNAQELSSAANGTGLGLGFSSPTGHSFCTYNGSFPCTSPSPQNITQARILTDTERKIVVEAPLQHVSDTLRRGAIADTAAHLNQCTRRTVSSVCQRAKKFTACSDVFASPSHKHRNSCKQRDHARELENQHDADPEAQPAVRCQQLCAASHQPRFIVTLPTTRLIPSPLSRRRSWARRTTKRLQFCLAHVNSVTLLYDDMQDAIHLDKTLFYTTTICIMWLPSNNAPIHNDHRSTK